MGVRDPGICGVKDGWAVSQPLALGMSTIHGLIPGWSHGFDDTYLAKFVPMLPIPIFLRMGGGW